MVTDLLPTEILNKPKMGFGLPIAKWFRNDLAPILKEKLLDETSARIDLFEQHLLQKMLNEHIKGRRDWSTRFGPSFFWSFGLGS